MRASHDEEGATLVIVAAALLMLFGIAAFAVDLAALRGDIRSDRLAADAAATAGAIQISPSSGSTADVACQVAWEYLLLNLEDEGPPTTSPNCAGFATACGSTSRFANADIGPYSIEITHPVLDGDSLMTGQGINPDVDGAACQRLGVEITREREFMFAPVIGADSGSTHIGSVARVAINAGEPEVVPLLVLEPVACDALFASGQGRVTVTHFEDTPGIIAVDSDGSGGTGPNACDTGNRFTIDPRDSGNAWIRALPVPGPDPIQSAILSYALSGRPGANASVSYDPADLSGPVTDVDPSDPAESRFRLYPRPMASTMRITRAPIDHRYNCKPSYDLYLGFVEVYPCADSPDPKIDEHVAAYEGPGKPTGFNQWEPTHDCAPAGDITVTGDWWVNCPGGFVVNGVDVVFEDGNVVFDGTVDLRSSGSLTVNNSGDDRFAYIRDSGDLIKTAQATITLNQTFVYMEAGRVDLVGGSACDEEADPTCGDLTWSAPLAGDFEDLALWAESDLEFQIGGQAGNGLTGTFFTPLADPFALTGQGGQFQTDAQFLTRRLHVKGQAEVRMRPDPDRQTLIPTLAVRLIR